MRILPLACVLFLTQVVLPAAQTGKKVFISADMEVHKEIEAAAREAVAVAQRVRPRREPAYKVEVQLRNTLTPAVAEVLHGMSRPAPDTIAFEVESMPRAYSLIRVLYRFVVPE